MKFQSIAATLKLDYWGEKVHRNQLSNEIIVKSLDRVAVRP
jgi:hypothetical protein